MVQMALQEVVCNGLKADKLQTNGVAIILSKYEENNDEKKTDGKECREKDEVDENKDNLIPAVEHPSVDMLHNNDCQSDTNDLAYLLDESTEIFTSSLLLSNNIHEMSLEKENLVENAVVLEKEETNSDVHECLIHPAHLALLNKLEASKNTISTLEDTINRLEKQLSLESNKTEKIEQLEKAIYQYEKEIQLSKQEHEIDQRTITTLKKEMETKLSSIKKQYDTANKEKENMVMRYAVSEKELLDCKKEKENIDKKMKEILKENESSLAKLKTVTSEKIKVTQQLESKASELSNVYKEIDKLKEEINSRDIKIKWTQNKLKSEMDAHKECAIIKERLNSNIKTLENEIDSYRKFQLEQDKILESKMNEPQSKIILDQQELMTTNKSLQSEYQALVLENNLISQQIENVEQIWLTLDSSSLKDGRVSSNDSDNESPSPVHKEALINLLKQSEHILSEIGHLRKANEKMLSDMATCQARGAELLSLSPVKMVSNNEAVSNVVHPKVDSDVQVMGDSQTLRNRIEDLERELLEQKHDRQENMTNIARAEQILAEVDRLRSTNEELMSDISACKSREAELLAFTQKLTCKNVQLQSEFSAIESKASELEMTEKNHAAVQLQLKQDIEQLQRNLAEEKDRRQEEIRLLARQVAEKTAKAENLLETVNTLQSELSLLKNKHAVQVKELQRELSQYKRKIEQLELSANCIGTPNSLTSGSKSNTSSLSSLNDSPVLQGIDVPAQVLVERIVRLQQESAKQSDRIEFLEEHSTQLVKELQKKSRLLQNYIMREQTGTLTSNSMDRSKAELSKSGGIMASLYGSKAADETMTFELCLEINRKLQAVLEDTLLKNITLKENIDTLGDEIARLSQKKS